MKKTFYDRLKMYVKRTYLLAPECMGITEEIAEEALQAGDTPVELADEYARKLGLRKAKETLATN